MRIALIPVVNNVELKSDSSAQTYVDMIRALNKVSKEVGEPLYFYVVLPKKLKDYEEFEQFDNVTVLIENRERQQFFEEVRTIDMPSIYKWFNQRVGLYQIDVVITSKTSVALAIQNILIDFRNASAKMDYLRIPVIVYEDRAFGRRNTHNVLDSVEFALRSMSYGFLPSVFLTDFERDDTFDVIGLYLNHAMLKRAKENSRVIYQGIDTEEIDNIVEGVEKRDKFTLFWGGRISAQKRFDFVFDAYLKVYEMGYDVDILLTSPSNVMVPKTMGKAMKYLKKLKGLHVKLGVGRKEFMRFAKSSHCWLSASEAEGFSLGHAELGYIGVPGVVPDRPWSRLLFGEDYELMYEPDDLESAVTMLLWVYENYDKAQSIAEKVRKRIKDNFDIAKTSRQLYALIDEVYHMLSGTTVIKDGAELSKTMDVVIEKLEEQCGGTFTLFEALNEFKKYLRVKPDYANPRVSMPGPWDVYHYLKKKGFVDLCNKPYPIFVKKR